MDPATGLTTAEQALRDLFAAAMYKKYGGDWLDKAVKPEQRQEWIKVRDQEARQRIGHALGGVTDLSYAFLGELVDLIRSKGNWKELFEPILGPREEAFALLNILQTLRRPVDHARPLLPFEEDLISGIAGRIRSQVTKYLSEHEPDGDYYPRIERIEDSLGNSVTYSPEVDLGNPIGVETHTTLRVGDTVTFRCQGTDPQGRRLTWSLLPSPPSPTPIEADGDQVDLPWTIRPADTGPRRWILIRMTHDGLYHRNVGSHNVDAVVVFHYRILPPL